MNLLILTGRLTKDPEVRYSQNESSTAVAKFSLAVDRRIKKEGEPDADFFNCVCFGKQAEFVEKYLRKGLKIGVRGEVRNDNYTNKDGQQVYGTKVYVDYLEFLEPKNSGIAAAQQPTTQGNDGFTPIPDEELPFN